MKPYVKNLKTGGIVPAEVRRLATCDLGGLLQLQSEASATLADSSLYIPSSKDDFERIMRLGEIHGMFALGRLCGACSFYMPERDDENLAFDVGFTREQAAVSAVLDSCFVAPDFRGNGIARELERICIRRAIEEKDAEYVLCTISPKNTASLAALMSINGVTVRALRQKYGGKLRYILCYEREPTRLYTVYERFLLSDVYSISKGLADGWRGIALFRNDEGSFLWLAK